MKIKYVSGVTVAMLFLVIFSLVFTGETKPNRASGSPGGDCLADRATGDVYKTPNGFCLAPDEEEFSVVYQEFVEQTPRRERPVIVSKNVPESENKVPVVKDQPKEENPPVEVPEKPEEKSCKNKNAGKDGTPAECNAGKGQEKKSP